MQGVLTNADSQVHTVSLGGGVPRTGYFHQKGAKAKTLKIVCKSCNNGWMSVLTDAAKSIILRIHNQADAPLSKQDKNFLYIYFAMLTMVIEFADYNTVAITQNERSKFYLRRELSSGWQLYIGFLDKIYGHGFNHVAWSDAPISFIRSSCEEYSINLMTNQVTVLYLGALAVFVSSTQQLMHPKLRGDVDGLLRIFPEGDFSSGLDRVITPQLMDKNFRMMLPEQLARKVRSQWDTLQDARSGRRRDLNDSAYLTNEILGNSG